MYRAYHGDQTRQLARDLGHRSVVPPPRYRNSFWSYDLGLYRRRNEVERFRRIATRCDKLDVIFLSFIHLGQIGARFSYCVQALARRCESRIRRAGDLVVGDQILAWWQSGPVGMDECVLGSQGCCSLAHVHSRCRAGLRTVG